MNTEKNQFTNIKILTKANRFVFGGFMLLSFCFYAYPEIDLRASTHFFIEGHGFPRDALWLKIGSRLPDMLIPLTVISVLIWGYFRYRSEKTLTVRGFRDILFFSVATLFSALLLVWCFKLGFSRVRPRFIQEFYGNGIFTPAFVINPHPSRDVSFISGHAATGFMYMAAAFLYQGRLKVSLMVASLALGTFIGITRLISGNHFLSDIVVSGFVVYFGIVFIEWVFSRYLKRKPAQSHNSAHSHSDL